MSHPVRCPAAPVVTPTPARLTQLTLHGSLLPTTTTPSAYTNAAAQLQLTDAQGKLDGLKGLMFPTGPAINHPAADVLVTFGQHGCPVDCGTPWTRDQIQAAIDYAAHPSARDPIAADALRKENLEKVTQGFADLIKWDDIKDDFPPQLKVSPIAAIPHKTRLFRAILDLSFVVKDNKDTLPSVNEATKPLSHPHALDELGRALPRLFQLLAWAPTKRGPPVSYTHLTLPTIA